MKDRIFPIPALSAIFHKNTGRAGGSADHQIDQMYEGRARGSSGAVRNFITGKPRTVVGNRMIRGHMHCKP